MRYITVIMVALVVAVVLSIGTMAEAGCPPGTYPVWSPAYGWRCVAIP